MSRNITRRRFVTAALAAGAAPLFLPRGVIAAAEGTPPSERVVMGMIGTGRQCFYKNIPLFSREKDCQIVAVCDVDSWRMAEAKKKVEAAYASAAAAGTYRGCESYLDYEDLLAREDIDAVMISTPDHWHAKMALDAMAAGKDVALEKPITRTIKEGQQLIAAAKEGKRIFRVDSEFRSGTGAHKAAELVRNGRLGRVHAVTVGVPQSDIPCPIPPEMPVPAELDYGRWQGPAPRAPYTLNRVHPVKDWGRPGWMRHLWYCDGMITNWGTHLNNGAMWCTDLERTGPVSVEGEGTYPGRDSFWNVLLKFRLRYKFACGIDWIYETSSPYFKIEGEHGWVHVTFGGIDASPKSLLSEVIGPDEIHFRLLGEKRDFLNGVRSREETLEPAEVGHRVTSLGLIGHIAIRLGQSLKFDPQAERFIDCDAANAYLDKPVTDPRFDV